MTSAPSQLRRPMDVGQIIDTAIRLYRLNFGEFLAISAVILPFAVVVAVINAAISDASDAATTVSAALLIPIFAAVIVAQAAMARALADIADGVAPDFNAVYMRVLKRLRSLMATGFRILLGIFILSMTLIGIPFAIYLLVRWLFFSQAIMIESESSLREATLQPSNAPRWMKNRILAKIERLFSSPAADLSAHLVDGLWWRTLGTLLIVQLLASFPAAAVSVLFAPANPVAAGLAGAVIGVIVFPFSAGALTLLFFDLQSRERERVSIA